MKTISKLKEMCVMCKEEEASVTMRPCGHMYCQGTYILVYSIIHGFDVTLHYLSACCRRPKVCFECKSSIESREGMGEHNRNYGYEFLAYIWQSHHLNCLQ